METEERRITEKNEKLVRAFYEAIARAIGWSASGTRSL
jgi:hypothetical protein